MVITLKVTYSSQHYKYCDWCHYNKVRYAVDGWERCESVLIC